MRAGRARLHYVEREDPGDGRPNRAARPACLAELQHALTHDSRIARPRHLVFTGATRSKNPQATTVTTINTTSFPYRLTNVFLRWCQPQDSLAVGKRPGMKAS
jgi:hypothetical protein